MEKDRYRLWIWLTAGLCLSPAAAVAETTSASASARITLHIAPRAQVTTAPQTYTPQLCLGRLPAGRVQLLYAGQATDLEQGNTCVPLPADAAGGELLISAQ